MCEPTTVMMALTAASTVMQGQAAKAEGKYQQGVANYNARLAENEAQRSRNAATEAENEQRRATAEQVSRQRAQAAASGVDVDFGSALTIQEDTQTLGEIDALRIRDTGDQQYQAGMSEGMLQRSQGEAAAAAGKNAFTGSLLSAAGSVAGSGVADKWFSSSSAAKSATSFAPMDASKTFGSGFTAGGKIKSLQQYGIN